MTHKTMTVTREDMAGLAVVTGALHMVPDDAQAAIEDLTGRNPANTEKALGIAADRLRSLVDRIERLTEEKAALTSDIKDIYVEAKSAGFSVPALRALIKERKKDAAEVADLQTMLDLYRNALGD